MHQRASDRRALFHAARQLIGALLDEIGRPTAASSSSALRPVCRDIEASHVDLEQHIAEHRAPVEQDRLLKDDAALGDRLANCRPSTEICRRWRGSVRRSTAAASTSRSPTVRRPKRTRRPRYRDRPCPARPHRRTRRRILCARRGCSMPRATITDAPSARSLRRLSCHWLICAARPATQAPDQPRLPSAH